MSRVNVSASYENENQENGCQVKTYQDKNGLLWTQETGGKRVVYTDGSQSGNQFQFGVNYGNTGFQKKVTVNNSQAAELKAIRHAASTKGAKNNGVEIRTDCEQAAVKYRQGGSRPGVDVVVIQGRLLINPKFENTKKIFSTQNLFFSHKNQN